MAENNKDKLDEDKTTKKKTNRGIIWPDTATFELLNIWKEENIRLALENTKSPQHTRAIYQDITVRGSTTILKGTLIFNTYDFYCLFLIDASAPERLYTVFANHCYEQSKKT